MRRNEFKFSDVMMITLRRDEMEVKTELYTFAVPYSELEGFWKMLGDRIQSRRGKETRKFKKRYTKRGY